jgi:hypothetical protein
MEPTIDNLDNAAGHARIDAMQLPQGDGFDLEPLAGLFLRATKIIGIALGRPQGWGGTGQSALGGDHKPVIGMKRFVDQIFRNLRAIGVGGVDEIDAQLRQALQRRQRFGLVLGRAPDAVTHDPHGAKAQPMDFRLAADGKAAGFHCIGHGDFLEGFAVFEMGPSGR